MGLVIASCSEFEDDEITTTIPIETFSVQNRSNLTIEFTASNSCGSMCWKRTYFEKTINGNDVIIKACLLYTSDAADERSSVDLGGRRFIKKKKIDTHAC